MSYYIDLDDDLGSEQEVYESHLESLNREIERDRQEMQAAYVDAKRAQVGATIRCPVCKKLTLKTTHHKVFCSNAKSGKGNCKDRYWNEVPEDRRMRASMMKKR